MYLILVKRLNINKKLFEINVIVLVFFVSKFGWNVIKRYVFGINLCLNIVKRKMKKMFW